MDTHQILLIVLTVAAVVFVAVVSITLLSIRRNMDQITKRVDESLRQLEMTAEDVRKTNTVVREILSDVERGVSNVTHLTDGVRALRGPVDVVSKVFDHAVSPAFINVASVLVGFKAATSHILERFVRKEEGK